MMRATCLLWLLSLFNKLSDRRYVFAFSLNQKSALSDVNRDFAMWIKMLFFAPKMTRDCTDIDVVLRQINQRLRSLRSPTPRRQRRSDASIVSLTRRTWRYII